MDHQKVSYSENHARTAEDFLQIMVSYILQQRGVET